MYFMYLCIGFFLKVLYWSVFFVLWIGILFTQQKDNLKNDTMNLHYKNNNNNNHDNSNSNANRTYEASQDQPIPNCVRAYDKGFGHGGGRRGQCYIITWQHNENY